MLINKKESQIINAKYISLLKELRNCPTASPVTRDLFDFIIKNNDTMVMSLERTNPLNVIVAYAKFKITKIFDRDAALKNFMNWHNDMIRKYENEQKSLNSSAT